MFGNIPLKILTVKGKVTLQLQIPKSFDDFQKELQKVIDFVPDSGGRGEHVVKEDGTTITQMTALKINRMTDVRSVEF